MLLPTGNTHNTDCDGDGNGDGDGNSEVGVSLQGKSQAVAPSYGITLGMDTLLQMGAWVKGFFSSKLLFNT
jgi:hypothetical protein